MNKDLCQNKACSNYLKYARYCGHLNGSLNKPKPVAPRSKKMEQVMRKEYRPQVKEMVEAGTLCSIGSPVCTKVAQGFHHKEGREGKALTGKNKVPCCNACNLWIEKNDAHARANGWKDSKHKNYKRQPKI
jgi:hypothetical protein